MSFSYLFTFQLAVSLNSHLSWLVERHSVIQWNLPIFSHTLSKDSTHSCGEKCVASGEHCKLRHLSSLTKFTKRKWSNVWIKNTSSFKKRLIIDIEDSLKLYYYNFYHNFIIICISYLFEFHIYCTRFSHHNHLDKYRLIYLHIYSRNLMVKCDNLGLCSCRFLCKNSHSSTWNKKKST